MRYIKLTQGKNSMVDDDIYELVGHLKWFAQRDRNNFYAGRNNRIDPSNYRRRNMTLLHHVVVGFPLIRGYEVDHIDGDGLNNTRANLRIITKRENLAKMRFINRTRSSKFTGVHRTQYGTWKSVIQHKRKRIYIGSYKKEEDAAKAYNVFRNSIENQELSPKSFTLEAKILSCAS